MRKYNLSGVWHFGYSKPILRNQDAALSREQVAGWEFVSAKPELEEIPADFSREIRVPGYWDDQPEAFKGLDTATNPEYAPIPYPMPDNLDASYPYIIGTVWYKRECILDEEAPYAELTLLGVSTEARVWANGHYVASAFGYSTPQSFSLDGYLHKGENTLLIAVDNDSHNHLGCITRGWKSFTGGLCRDVELRVTGRCRIQDAAAFAADREHFTLDALFDGDTDDAELGWEILDGDACVLRGSQALSGMTLRKDISAAGLASWSDTDPKVYTLRLTLKTEEGTADEKTVPFGFRVFERDGLQLRLNGHPIYLRGATEHAYYPETCTAPTDVENYLKNLRVLKDYGFNFLRFHTSVPNEEYMTAMDRLGFLAQIEPPVKFSLEEFEDILRTVRRHPCVCIVCAGNEELLDEDKLSYIARAARMSHSIFPSALFSPQEALRGIEYGWKKTDQGTDCIMEPFRHNARRMAVVRRYSDIFEPTAGSFLSYNSCTGDNHELDRRFTIYGRPLLGHEAGIYGSYVDLSLEKRYEGTRIGTEMYAKAREYLTREGLIDNWKTYWYNSCLLQSSIRKSNIEVARRVRRMAGFDYLGAIDHHWHHTGYQCGLLNEFYEEKPGSTRKEVLLWNSPVVLLWDNRIRWTFACGEEYSAPFTISQFGSEDWDESTLSWTLADSEGGIAASGGWKVPAIPCGSVEDIGEWQVTMPAKTGKYALSVSLTDGLHTVRNHWNLWCFDTGYEGCGSVKVTDALTEDDIAALENGARILLTDTAPFPAQKLDFQPMPAGRPLGMTATVIADHPVFRDFPHDGWCDWQFRTMLQGGTAVRWGTVNAPENPAEFRPILDVCMGYKTAGRFAALCEFAVGKGRLLVCGLNLKDGQPEQRAMKNCLVRYLSGSLTDAPVLTPAQLSAFLEKERSLAKAEFDMGYDKAGQKPLEK